MNYVQTDRLTTLVSGAHSWPNSNVRKCGFTENEPWMLRYNIEIFYYQRDREDMVLNNSLVKCQLILSTK